MVRHLSNCTKQEIYPTKIASHEWSIVLFCVTNRPRSRQQKKLVSSSVKWFINSLFGHKETVACKMVFKFQPT